MNQVPFIVRQATVTDVDAIAQVHVASIHSLGARVYSQTIVEAWGAPRDGSRYLRAMERGEIFFVAVRRGKGKEQPLAGFSSYRFEEGRHRTAVYVHGNAARSGVGTALLQAAQKVARQRGASEIHVDASLAAVDFYLANGFEKASIGEHVLSSGTPMACVFMRKLLDT